MVRPLHACPNASHRFRFPVVQDRLRPERCSSRMIGRDCSSEATLPHLCFPAFARFSSGLSTIPTLSLRLPSLSFSRLLKSSSGMLSLGTREDEHSHTNAA